MKISKFAILPFLFSSLVGVGRGLYAQDPQLFQNTWYLHELVVDGISNIPPINVEIPFIPAQFYENGILDTGMCENTGSGDLEYIGIDEFLVLEMVFLQGECYENIPFNQDFSNLYQNFWSPLVGSGTITYDITEEGTLSLTITSPNGDYAVYKDVVLLSIDSFLSNYKFMIYPNPVIEILNVKKLNNTINGVFFSIHDLQGKLMKFESIEEINTNISLNVNHLKSGLYFLTISKKNGEKQTLKFIKQ
jgi:hypothetical protein